jgi:hypothetical protein
VLSGEAKNTNFIVVCLYEENDSLIVLLVDNQYQFRRGRDRIVVDTNVFEEIGWFIVCNASFNNISVISWQSVLMVEEITEVSGENRRPATSH